MIGKVVWLVTLFFAMSACGQGRVLFANKVEEVGLDAPVLAGAGIPQGVGPGFTAQLFLVGANNSLTPLLPTSTFYAPGLGAQAIMDRYWEPKVVEVPGVEPGTMASFLVRVWETSYGSFENAALDGVGNGPRGQSSSFTAFVGGGTIPPSTLNGLTSFYGYMIPEPGTLLVSAVGAAALFLGWRRRCG